MPPDVGAQRARFGFAEGGGSASGSRRLRGRSRHNKVVNFSGLGTPGEFVSVEITSATSQTLAGHESILSRAAGR